MKTTFLTLVLLAFGFLSAQAQMQLFTPGKAGRVTHGTVVTKSQSKRISFNVSRIGATQSTKTLKATVRSGSANISAVRILLDYRSKQNKDKLNLKWSKGITPTVHISNLNISFSNSVMLSKNDMLKLYYVIEEKFHIKIIE